MAHSLSAVSGDVIDVVPIQRVLISVSDKTNIIDFITFITTMNPNVQLLSTGGTAKTLRSAGLSVMDVSDYTGAQECLDGRVKTLHPKVHGGLLGVRGNQQHEREMIEQGINTIDMTIVNLYPFEETIKNKNNVTYEQCIENIDIGGPSMLRSTAKNHAFTTIVTSPTQYDIVKTCMKQNNGGTTLLLRKQLAAHAFALSAAYDSSIATWFYEQSFITKATTTTTTTETAKETEQQQEQQQQLPMIPPVVTRVYQHEFPLKYGCNPHQQPASILSRLHEKLPFIVHNGTPGYINLLDAANAWQLVYELQQATGLVAAASFKHVSPAGAAVAVPLSDIECQAYEVNNNNDNDNNLTPAALAYLRARNADPLCSFGDFCALSDQVDEATANILKKEVSDGIVAPSYTKEALSILKTKKNGKFIILQAVPNYDAGDMEYREVYGMTFAQKRNTIVIGKEEQMITKNIVTEKKELNIDAERDLILASICLKYTQSNSVGFAKDGMMVGIGAGQQSRVDCVKLAGRKVMTWYLRQHPKVLQLPFKDNVKKQDRINARVRYIEGDFTNEERQRWELQFTSIPEPLTDQDKNDFLSKITNVAISSDAFFPFRDSIDHASKVGVSYVAQPGGSVQDPQVIEACNEYGMVMSFTGVRLFHH